jgi:hypothetical protein
MICNSSINSKGPVPRRHYLANLRGLLLHSPLGAAVFITLLNTLKPLHADDTAYYYYAAHIAEDPLHPYDFEIFWGQFPEPAMDVLAPPVLPYWWAVAIRLFGRQPWVWKLWLFPFCLILTTSLQAIFRRFAHGLEMMLVWMTAFSPAILPGINLMLDVPALALNLGSLALFFQSVDRGSTGLAILAGLVGGLAAQTKYTGLSAPAAMLLYAALFGRVRLGLIAASVAAVVFASCEGLIALVHGRSHLLINLGGASRASASRWGLVAALPALVGALAPTVAVLGLVGLGLRRRLVVLAGAVVAAGFYLLGVAPLQADRLLRWFWPSLGILAFGVAAVAGLLLTRIMDAKAASGGRHRLRRSDVFLVLWLGLEVASYFALTTFPAARRVLGVVVALTALCGRLASRTCRAPARAALLPGIMVGGMALGGLYFAIDLCEAAAERGVVEEASHWIHRREPDATIWYVGHWGFQFYAERAGLRPIVPGRSRLKAGDWLVIPDQVEQQGIHLAVGQVNPAHTIARWHPLGYRTLGHYYQGKIPIRGDRKPYITVWVYRAARDFIPEWDRPW